MSLVLRIDEMAAFLKTDEAFLRDLADKKVIPHIRQSGDVLLFQKEEVISALAAKGIAIPDVSEPPAEKPDVVLPPWPTQEDIAPEPPEVHAPVAKPIPAKRKPGRPKTK